MKATRFTIVMLILILALTACSLSGETGDDDRDDEAAQSFVPNLTGYDLHETDNLQDTMAAAAGGASVLTGNVVVGLLIQRVDSLIDCYREVGAVEAVLYTERIDVSNPRVPIGGALAVINQDRVRDNFLACVTDIGMGVFGAQAAEPEPCYGYGTFDFSGDTISFIYAATDQPLCDALGGHFAQYNPTGNSGPVVIPRGSQ